MISSGMQADVATGHDPHLSDRVQHDQGRRAWVISELLPVLRLSGCILPVMEACQIFKVQPLWLWSTAGVASRYVQMVTDPVSTADRGLRYVRDWAWRDYITDPEAVARFQRMEVIDPRRHQYPMLDHG